MMYRQGDLLLIPIESLPFANPRPPDERGRLVLALGEATGHAHVIESALAELFDDRHGELYLRVQAGAGEPVRLVHEEHAPLTLPAGSYRVVRQVQYDPLDRQPRHVRD